MLPTCFAWHSHHAFLLFPEADVILEGQEVKEELQNMTEMIDFFWQ